VRSQKLMWHNIIRSTKKKKKKLVLYYSINIMCQDSNEMFNYIIKLKNIYQNNEV
jgi:hypothetical protein